MTHSPVLLALMGTGITFAATVIGAAAVLFMKKKESGNAQNLFLGFASGIMIAASVWSLLLPAIDMAEKQGGIKWLPTTGGFLAGGAFLYLLDKLMPHLHPGFHKAEGMKSSLRRTTLLVFAVTLHNIPEGMAVGLAFAIAAKHPEALGGAFALAAGMALQNLPEGAAISLPLRSEGFSRRKAFAAGAASGIVEPIAGVITAFVAVWVIQFMPFLLSFAAGAMIYVVVEELVPEAHSEHTDVGTIGAMVGFAVMMVLDVAFG